MTEQIPSFVLTRLDAARLFLYRELVKVGRLPVERGEGSMADWDRRNRDENEPFPSDQVEDLFTVFEFVWGACEHLAKVSELPFVPLEGLEDQVGHLLKAKPGGTA